MSWMYDYKRPKFNGRHGLATYGEQFNFPKGDFHEFEKYSDEMLSYCRQDVRLNIRIYQYLAAKCREIIQQKPLFAKGLKIEHRWAYYEMSMREKGWKFNEHQARLTHKKWVDRMDVIKKKLEPNMRPRMVHTGDLKLKQKKTGGYFASVLRVFPEEQLRPLSLIHI